MIIAFEMKTAALDSTVGKFIFKNRNLEKVRFQRH